MTDYYSTLTEWIKKKARDFGFVEIGIAVTTIDPHSQARFREWLAAGFHGQMDYLANNQQLRFNPQLLQPQTVAIISVALPYLQQKPQRHLERLQNAEQGYISAYALGRDYHKVVKQKLEKLAAAINDYIKMADISHRYRVFSDSAPIMEVELASNANLGWKGKHSLLISKNHGSMFFLGEIFTNLPLIADNQLKHTQHCGSCTKCLQICPTQAIIAPQVLDARRCISYLTIENPGIIPVEFRRAIANRIYGCDDCQLLCPWNKFAALSLEADFATRHELDNQTLIELFNWSESEFKQRMAGSAIYRIGYQRWQRNLAVAIGNAPSNENNLNALHNRLPLAAPLVAEHIQWAIEEQSQKQALNHNRNSPSQSD